MTDADDTEIFERGDVVFGDDPFKEGTAARLWPVVEDERLADYFGEQRRLHGIGGRYYDDGEWNYGYAVPAAEFDGLIHVAETTPTVPLDGGD